MVGGKRQRCIRPLASLALLLRRQAWTTCLPACRGPAAAHHPPLPPRLQNKEEFLNSALDTGSGSLTETSGQVVITGTPTQQTVTQEQTIKACTADQNCNTADCACAATAPHCLAVDSPAGAAGQCVVSWAQGARAAHHLPPWLQLHPAALCPAPANASACPPFCRTCATQLCRPTTVSKGHWADPVWLVAVGGASATARSSAGSALTCCLRAIPAGRSTCGCTLGLPICSATTGKCAAPR